MTLILRGTDNSVSAPAVQGGTAGTTTGEYFPATNQWAVATNGTQAILVDASQRVLINKTSTDGGYLNVQNGSTTTRAYTNATLRNSRPAGTNYSVVSWNGSFVADSWIGQVPGTDALCFGHDAGTTIVEDMRIDTNGYVGIGTTSPIRKLTVSTAGAAEFVLQDTSQAANSRNWRMFNTGNTLYFGTLNDAGSSGTDAVKITSGADLQFNSGYGSVATAYGCRAWVSFTGSTAAIRGSANVSSITRNGTGNYVVNYSTALPDTNYSAVASCAGQGSVNGSTNCMLVNASAGGTNVAPTTTATTLFCYHPGNQVAQDTAYINFAVFR